MAFSWFWFGDLDKKQSVGGGLAALQFLAT